MVSSSAIVASNKRLAATFPDQLVAIFVGGTSGVGEYTLKALARYAPQPRIYIVGRSRESADRIISECQDANANGVYEFVQADISLLKNIDDVCRQIRSKEKAINLLFQTQGTMAFSKTTSEGLPLASSVTSHGRTRFVLNLLPLLRNAKTLRRVVSVAAATYEGPIDLNNLAGDGYTLHQWRDQTASLQTLLMDEVARRAPDVAFVHSAPGVVKSGIMRDLEPTLGLSIIIGISKLLVPFIQTSPDECAEQQLFIATSARFPARQQSAGVAGVSLGSGLQTARGIDGQTGSGMYSVDNKGESASSRVESLLRQFKSDGTAEKAWERITADYVKITGAEVGV
ncbi:putative short-chain dehydrogenases/reductase [Cryphonectria parasitica EP155]|uniref:Short-chain dehydrogenases/reductase n=1 Tax=Cryphonectria parasitica (strain ATCC 38755 / EP155) TaxID=660469 RepID=A0A9P4XZB7_CRYP1|nr:putative short-chain dehydrogenases/reductase [Cryphonectria parasitica EP155]KAF3763681.1 putative short-chain dehydrogenases/reductase [Cryphonectria parasitica EP155]